MVFLVVTVGDDGMTSDGREELRVAEVGILLWNIVSIVNRKIQPFVHWGKHVSINCGQQVLTCHFYKAFK
jgi:hypothetical protein